MSKRLADLTDEELDKLAADAWFEASNAALRAGAPVVGREGSKIIKTYPDGRTEIVGDAAPLVELDAVPPAPGAVGTGSLKKTGARTSSKQTRRSG